MKKARLVLPLLLLVGTGVAWSVNLQDYGYTVTGSHTQNSQTVYDASDAQGQTFTVASTQPLSDADVRILGSVLQTLAGWRDLKIGQLQFLFTGGRADILVIPTSFLYRGVDLAKYMPSGIQFYYDTYLQYDFRMLKDNLFLRLKGAVYDESQFAQRAYSAVQNPVLFIQSNDPEYLLQRLNEIASAITSIQAQLDASNKTLAIAVQEAKTELNRQQTSDSQIRDQLSVLQERSASIQSSLDHVRFGVMALNNKGFFGLGRPTPPSQQAVDRVLALKQADPSMTMGQVSAKLKSEGLSMTNKELSLVFAVYFNQYQ